MKNISFTVEPKNGAFVNSRMSALHHSAESRIGLVEAGIACLIVAVLVCFAFVIVG